MKKNKQIFLGQSPYWKKQWFDRVEDSFKRQYSLTINSALVCPEYEFEVTSVNTLAIIRIPVEIADDIRNHPNLFGDGERAFAGCSFFKSAVDKMSDAELDAYLKFHVDQALGSSHITSFRHLKTFLDKIGDSELFD